MLRAMTQRLSGADPSGSPGAARSDPPPGRISHALPATWSSTIAVAAFVLILAGLGALSVIVAGLFSSGWGALVVALLGVVWVQFATMLFHGTDELVLGSDGLWVKCRWRGTRMIRWSDIRRMKRRQTGFTLELESGKRLRFITRKQDEHVVDLVADWIRRLPRRSSSHAGDVPEARLPARGDRTAREWLNALRGAETADPFRSDPVRSAVDGAELWRIVEDGRAEPIDRAAAAAAVTEPFDEADRARVRVAADAAAQPELRVALESVANADDDALTEALDALGEASGAEGRLARR